MHIIISVIPGSGKPVDSAAKEGIVAFGTLWSLLGTKDNEAHLEGIDGRDAYISGAVFNRAHLNYANFRRARGEQKGVSFQLAFLEQVDF